MLVAVGLHPDSLCDIDPGLDGWQERLGTGALVVADVVAARAVPAGFDVRVFRMIAEASLTELSQYIRKPAAL